ncbi:hypothetical protein O181_016240 [Austropuccinia psidii MF-1]|uniref:FAD/NAD(P)-binding domain-containing protein n=1 Tax=Austropuccinia psidii MF-1 TaxID=1389203 RepID=A0A9Q3C4G9_9BASI|nr:hypothetical protein [Austropuccinia psidii MF-1]
MTRFQSFSLNRSVVVIGGSYSGRHAAEMLAQQLPPNWSVTLIERNSHFNHVYSFPRSGVIGSSQRNFIPYIGLLKQFEIDQSTQSSKNKLIEFKEKINFEDCHSISSNLNLTRLQFINASVTKIIDGRVYLDRMIQAQTDSTLPTLSISSKLHSASSSTLKSDSGYASSISLRQTASQHNQLDQNIENFNTLNLNNSSRLTNQIKWDFLVYALGSKLPPPLQISSAHEQCFTKQQGVRFLEKQKSIISKAKRIVIVGGGALGIQYACDIAHRYQLLGQPKQITLIHSRNTFLPLFQPEVDNKVKDALKKFGVNVVLGERVNLAKLGKDLEERSQCDDQRSIIVESMSVGDKQWEADYVLLCTGQLPNTALMAQFCPLAVPGGTASGASHGLIRVNRALQVSPSTLGPSPVHSATGRPTTCECGSATLRNDPTSPKTIAPLSRVFAIGDCIDGFGSIKAGHVGWNQAEVAARNIVKLATVAESGGDIAEVSNTDGPLESYEPSPPMIKLTLGLDRMICQLPSAVQPNVLEVFEKEIDVHDDVAWRKMWVSHGIEYESIGDGWA